MPDLKAPRAALAPPVPTTPTKGETAPLDAVVFQWSAPPGASSFDLRVAHEEAPDSPVLELTDLDTTEAEVADGLPSGPLLWWVRQSGGGWSRPARFVAGTAADVQVEDQQVADERGVSGAAPAAPPNPVWPHVQGPAIDPDAPPVDWSAMPGFGTPQRPDVPTVEAAPPRPLGPLGGEVVDAVTVALRWEGVPGATGYDVELSPHPKFDRDVLALDAGGAVEIALPGLVPSVGSRLLWRVRARTARGATRWSPYGRFYPAGDEAATRFRIDLDAAIAAQRKQREHARRAEAEELSLVPLHQRPDAVTTVGTVASIVGMMITGLVLLAIAAAFALAIS